MLVVVRALEIAEFPEPIDHLREAMLQPLAPIRRVFPAGVEQALWLRVFKFDEQKRMASRISYRKITGEIAEEIEFKCDAIWIRDVVGISGYER